MSFFSEYREVTKLLRQKRQVVFYAETRHYYQYFEKLIVDLLDKKSIEICYITSDNKDPLLTQAPDGMKVIYIKWLLGFLFSRINAYVMLMTMPDLGNFLFRRSPQVHHYIYIFHAAVSTHHQYNLAAFFNYDAIFCVGDYQKKEIRLAEKMYNQNEKTLIGFGYPLFDEIKKKTAVYRNQQPPVKNILVAPSWFEGCIFDTCIKELLEKLSGVSYHVIIRSHPEYEKRKKKEFGQIKKMIKSYPNMSIDFSPDVIDRLSGTDILITDRSGIAFEFAFGVGKPVLFIETALKQTNKEWEKTGIGPIENSLRGQMGVSILPSQLNDLEAAITEVENKTDGFRIKMEKLEKVLFYNSAESYKAGADYIIEKIHKD